jgi:hypothetical protein
MAQTVLSLKNRVSAPLAAQISASVEESDCHRARRVSGSGSVGHIGAFSAGLNAPHSGVVLVGNDNDEHLATQAQLVAAPRQVGAGKDMAATA